MRVLPGDIERAGMDIIQGELETMDQLLEKSPVLRDFKAVQGGQVWCTGKTVPASFAPWTRLG